MTKNPTYTGLKILLGFTCLSPVIYSTSLMDMQLAQKMSFFCVSLILFLVYLLQFTEIDEIRFYKPLSILMLLFPLTFFTSFFNGSESLLILQLTNLAVPLTIILLTVLIFLVLGEDDFFKLFSFSVVAVSTLFSVIGLMEVYGINIILLPTIIGPGSTLGHRSFAAEFLLTSLPFLLIANKYVNKKNKQVLLLFAFIQISFLFFTRNRSAMVIMLVILVLYFLFILFKKKKGRRIKFVLPVAAVMLISILFALQPVNGSQRPEMGSTVETFFNTDYKSNRLRLKYWNASLQMITENPFIGMGLMKWSGYFPKYSGEYFNDDNVFYVQSIHSHNDILELGSENGLTASLIFLLIIFFVCYSLWEKSKSDEKYLYLLFSFLITVAFSFVAFPIHKFSSFFSASVAAGVALLNIRGEMRSVINIKYNQLKIVVMLLLIIGVVVSFIKIESEVSLKEAINAKDARRYILMRQKLDDVSTIFYPFDPAKQPVDYYRAIANYRLKNFTEALKLDIKARDLAPYNAPIMRNIAGTYQTIGNFEKSEKLYEEFKDIFPNYIDPQINLIGVYFQQGETNKAKNLLEELLKKAPQNSRLLEIQKKISTD